MSRNPPYHLLGSPLASDAGATSTPSSRGLRTIDDLARDPASHGFVVVRGPRSALASAARHVVRRARANGRAVLHALGTCADDPWRELAAKSGIATADPLEAARAIFQWSRGAIVVVADPAPRHWGGRVAEELAAMVASDASTLFLVLGERAIEGVRTCEIDGSVTPEEARLWWEAVASEAHAQTSSLERLEQLESWWAAARAAPLDAPPRPSLDGASGALLVRLQLSRRAWPLSLVARLGDASKLQRLASAQLVEIDEASGVVSATTAADEVALPVDASAPRDVAEALVASFPEDPWSQARASELFAACGDAERAESSMFAALGGVTDVEARSDFWQRWEHVTSALPAEGGLDRRLASAELALRLGDVDRAFSLAQAASQSAASFEALLLLGRATAARGDLTTARVALERAKAIAKDADERARVDVELAEIHCASGDLEAARAAAEAALAEDVRASTRLGARNVIGKLLLARGAWVEADHHFAADACDAALAGDGTAELRARMNRAIALLSSGRHEEARGMLHEILEEGERRRESKATVLALANLAVIATSRHEYVEALRLWERTIESGRRMGDRIGLVRRIVNLAELRLRVGLVAEAEQALLFGRKVFGTSLPGAAAAEVGLVAARIHLAKGNTLLASAELASAIASAAGSSDGAKLGECHREEARIALEDGDVPRAMRAVERAAALASSAEARADVALLRAQCARAAGEAFGELAALALDLARAADDGELLRDAHVLMHHAALANGDVRAARTHVAAAISIRDRVASALTADLRARYLARPALAELARLEAAATAVPEPPPSVEPTTLASGSTPAPRPSVSHHRIVGEHPSIRSLLAAIQKVGASDATVLVHGESGTGKELVAEALHEASPRKNGPLVKVNCAALVETLLLSELFGHEKGSFTGAGARRRGRFELAEGGTIFLDEIGDISPRTQVALLRVLQDRTFERVGGVTPIRANVRIVCATHRDLRSLVARGEFREDLYYRLRGVVLEVPALRHRLSDLPLVAEAILARIASERRMPVLRLSRAALDLLLRHTWPGNVRELENALRAAALFAEGDVIRPEDFTDNVEGMRHLADAASSTPSSRPPGTQAASSGTVPPPPSADAPTSATLAAYAQVRGGISLHDMKRQIEEECIARALAESKGNITKAAALLGMKRPRLSQLVKQYGLHHVSEES